MTINILQFLIGALFLYYGAEFLIKGSKYVAAKFNLSPIIIGITLVAFGTSLPELIVSILANLRGESGMVIGNVMGSNIANFSLVLGITATLSPIYFPFAKIRNDLYILILITFLLLGLIYMGELVFYKGIVLILVLIIYCIYLIRSNQLDANNNKIIECDKNFIIVIQIIIGIVGLALGSTLLIEGAQGIALSLGISSLIIGMSIVALGTSLPELAASLSAARHREAGFVIGNIIGSNIMNIVLVLGVSILIRNISIDFFDIINHGLFMIILTLSLFFQLKWNNRVTQLSGIISTLSYILFLYFNFQSI